MAEIIEAEVHDGSTGSDKSSEKEDTESLLYRAGSVSNKSVGAESQPPPYEETPMGLDEIQEEAQFMAKAKSRANDLPSPSGSDLNSLAEEDRLEVIPSEVKVEIEDAVEAITPIPQEPAASGDKKGGKTCNKSDLDAPPPGTDAKKTGKPSKPKAKTRGAHGKPFTEEEEKILEVLREVVKVCTEPDPMKRPTATEVLEMLNKCPVKQNHPYH